MKKNYLHNLCDFSVIQHALYIYIYRYREKDREREREIESFINRGYVISIRLMITFLIN